MSDKDRTEEFLSLYNPEQRSIYAFIRSLLFTQEDAEDVFQETCIALWRAFDQFETGTDFSAWARQVARNRVLAFQKKKLGDRHVYPAALVESLASEFDRTSVLQDRRMRALETCITKLHDRDRELIAARYSKSTSTVELASRLKRPLSTIYKSLTRIRRNLQQCINSQISREEHA